MILGPNITGKGGMFAGFNRSPSNAYGWIGAVNTFYNQGGGSSYYSNEYKSINFDFDFDASKSNQIYSSETIQVSSCYALMIIKA